MININAAPTTAEELEKMVAFLRREGLLGTISVPITAPGKMRRNPRASKAEMETRAKIDELNIQIGNEPVDWKDFDARQDALLPYGFTFNGESFTLKTEEEGESFTGNIDLKKIPV